MFALEAVPTFTDPKELVAVNDKLDGVMPVAVIPFAVVVAEMELAHATLKLVVFEPVVVGLAITPTVQLEPAVTLEQFEAFCKVKFVASPILTVHAVAFCPPELDKVTVLELELAPVVIFPKLKVSGLKAKLGALSPVTVKPFAVVAAETPPEQE